MTSNNDEALNFYGYSSYEQLEQALLEQGYGLDDVSVRIDSMRQDYELRNEVEQLKEGQMMEIIFDGR